MPKRRKKMSKAEAGRIGGRTTKKRHGIEHYRQAGKKGFMVTVARHWAGDKWSYIRYLHECGWLTEVVRLFEARPYGPDGIKSIEIPILPGELEAEEAEDPLIAQILASIRSAPVPADGGL